MKTGDFLTNVMSFASIHRTVTALNLTLSHQVAKFIKSRILSFAVNKNLRVTYLCQDINEGIEYIM